MLRPVEQAGEEIRREEPGKPFVTTEFPTDRAAARSRAYRRNHGTPCIISASTTAPTVSLLRCLSATSHSVDPIVDRGAGNEATLSDEDRLVHPRVPLVAGLQPRTSDEVLVCVIGWRVPPAHHGHDSRSEFEDPEVLGVDDRAIVGLHREAHVDASESVGSPQHPV